MSGLLSRTFLRPDIIGPEDYHGAAFYEDLRNRDLTYTFIERIEACYGRTAAAPRDPGNRGKGMDEVLQIARDFGVNDINLIKPGIGEATRVLLRRLPWKMLVHSMHDEEHLGHLYLLAKEKKVEVIEYPLVNYRACGIIRQLADA